MFTKLCFVLQTEREAVKLFFSLTKNLDKPSYIITMSSEVYQKLTWVGLLVFTI